MTAMVEPFSDAEIKAVSRILTAGLRPIDSGELRDRALEVLKNQRSLYGEMLEVLSSIEAAFGVMTATPADTIREHGVAMRAKVSDLEERRQVHLELIAKLSQSAPLDDEVKGALEARGKLVAEIGTLRARVFDLEVEQESAKLAYDKLVPRFTAIYEAWFGVPGAMTPEIMKDLRQQFGAMEQAKFDAEERERALLRRIEAFTTAVTASQDAAQTAEVATENVETVITEMLEHVRDTYGSKKETIDG